MSQVEYSPTTAVVDEASHAAAIVTAALQTSNGFDELCNVLEKELADLRDQHGLLMAQLSELQTVALADAAQSATRCIELAQRLESSFTRIDRVQRGLDSVNEKIVQVHDVLKAIDAPVNVKERASNLLKSIGFGKSAGSNAAEAIFSRTPTRPLLDGSSPGEYSHRVHGVFRALAQGQEVGSE